MIGQPTGLPLEEGRATLLFALAVLTLVLLLMEAFAPLWPRTVNISSSISMTKASARAFSSKSESLYEWVKKLMPEKARKNAMNNLGKTTKIVTAAALFRFNRVNLIPSSTLLKTLAPSPALFQTMNVKLRQDMSSAPIVQIQTSRHHMHKVLPLKCLRTGSSHTGVM